MPDSVQEQIIKKVALSFGTVAPVQRDMAAGPKLDVVPTILLQEGDCMAELGSSVYPSLQMRMKLNAIAIVSQELSTDPRSDAERLNAMMADMEVCLANNRTWDGLAILTEPPNYIERIIEAETPHMARALEFEVVFERLRVDPYNQ